MAKNVGLLQIAAAVKKGKLELDRVPKRIQKKVSALTKEMTLDQLQAYAYPERPDNFKHFTPASTFRKARTA